jgi:hypothetical protein
MFKNLILAVLIAVVLTYSFGHIATQWFDLHISLEEYDIEPFTSILVATAIVAVLVVVGFVVAFSVMAAIVFGCMALAIGLFVAGMSVFWPVFLFVLVIFLLVQDKPVNAY